MFWRKQQPKKQLSAGLKLGKSKKKPEVVIQDLAEEIGRLEQDLVKLSAQCEAYQEALRFAEDIAEIAKNAYWGSDRAKKQIQTLIDAYSGNHGIWHNWDLTVKDLKSGDAMRRILAHKIA